MKFEITRNSAYGDEVPPIEGAVLAQRPRVDERTVDDPSKLKYGNVAETWYLRGTNHRVENGHIKRDLEMVSVWVIEIESLEALLALVRDCGHEIVLTENSIEIYDNYWE